MHCTNYYEFSNKEASIWTITPGLLLLYWPFLFIQYVVNTSVLFEGVPLEMVAGETSEMINLLFKTKVSLCCMIFVKNAPNINKINIEFSKSYVPLYTLNYLSWRGK